MNPFLFGNPAAIGQQTIAGRMIVANAAGNGVAAPRRRRRKSAKRAAPARRRRASAAKKKPARLVKGSAAAKRYMASIRRKRK